MGHVAALRSQKSKVKSQEAKVLNPLPTNETNTLIMYVGSEVICLP